MSSSLINNKPYFPFFKILLSLFINCELASRPGTDFLVTGSVDPSGDGYKVKNPHLPSCDRETPKLSPKIVSQQTTHCVSELLSFPMEKYIGTKTFKAHIAAALQMSLFLVTAMTKCRAGVSTALCKSQVTCLWRLCAARRSGSGSLIWLWAHRSVTPKQTNP
jgi:hypothetical protein